MKHETHSKIIDNHIRTLSIIIVLKLSKSDNSTVIKPTGIAQH